MKYLSQFNRRQILQYGALFLASNLITACGGNKTKTTTADGQELDSVTFGTNWYAQAEHGGFYQAIAAKIYPEHGLDVKIEMGGAQVNGTQLLMGNVIDFYMGSGADAIQAVAEGIPKVTVAAIFQKDPQVLIAHPDQGIKTIEDLAGKPIYVSASANTTYWPLLKLQHGLKESQKRPYNFSIGPFLADKNAVQQGYLSSEPYTINKEAGFEPVVLLLADYGFTPYSTTIETRQELVDSNPDLVQRFVDASIEGWKSYLENPAPGNELIKAANPEMTDELLEYGLSKIKEYGLITSGDAQTQGIGIMTDARWQEFFDVMVEAGVYNADTDYQKAYTLQFVNQDS
ncbi:MAG: ABC transporter substrate-binding protein [Jaaginema sp. PMC 1079.18]|nr:ABC transporter substrate-binding protein [Jaaginema sp. PMC 1080.18]MEC4850365.1 ABC transporter substrate-binding protein [Jaaginema sp. PMC 1079.18]MEC4864985.1 ABC transporter substrate-binding protein [Jaaginema sp. PMC 1078.18]